MHKSTPESIVLWSSMTRPNTCVAECDDSRPNTIVDNNCFDKVLDGFSQPANSRLLSATTQGPTLENANSCQQSMILL